MDEKINVSEISLITYTECKLLVPIYAIRELPKKLKRTMLEARIPNPGKDSVAKIHSHLAFDEEETKYSPGFTDPNFLQLIDLDI